MMNFALIGTGGIARVNARALLDTGRARIVALQNRTPERAQRLSRELNLGARVYRDCEEMLNSEQPDAALIASPHAMHREHALACARRGIPMLIEKPLGVSLGECREMTVAAQKAGVRAYVCHTQRYIPQIRGLLGAARDESLGRLLHVSDTMFLHYFHDRRGVWCFDAALAGGGLLAMHGAHQMDRLLLVLGASMRVRCARVDWESGYKGIDRGYVAMGENDAGVTFEVTCSGAPVPHESGMTLVFERGALRASLFGTPPTASGLWRGDENGWCALPLPFPDDQRVFYRMQFDSLLDALEGRVSDAPSMEHATDVLRLIESVRALDANKERSDYVRL